MDFSNNFKKFSRCISMIFKFEVIKFVEPYLKNRKKRFEWK